MSAGMDATDSALIEDWNKYLMNLRVTDQAAYHLTNRYFRFFVRQWRRPRLMDYLWSLRAMGLYIAIFSIAATAVVLLAIFTDLI